MRTHISLGTRDLDRSISFYTTLFDLPPAKVHEDYALFVSDDPALELALNTAPLTVPTIGVHYGIAVASPDAVDAAVERFRAAGLKIDLEVEETCCYAKQTKAWVSDPDGRRWETYAVLEEVEASSACGSGSSICCSP